MSQTWNESRKTPVKGEYDVIVCGGGPSGCAAAVLAGRAGAKVLLIEQENCLGGMWTAGFVNPLFDYKNKGGLLEELIDDLKSSNDWGGFWNMSFHYERMKLLLEEKCTAANVELLYETRYAGVLQEKNKVLGVLVENIEGRSAYLGKVIVDATGDAAVAADAGAKWVIGESNEHDCQAMTLMYLVGNIPPKYSKGLMLNTVLNAAYERQGEGRKPPFEVPYMIPVPNCNFGVMQLTHMRGYSPLSAIERTKAVIEGRKQVMESFEILRDYDEDFRDLILLQSAPLLGVRESRRIIGEYVLTEQDLFEGKKFEDTIATASFGIDVHDSNKTSQTCHRVESYQIPYRCLIPQGLENLLVAGKTISGTHLSMASYRVTGNCCAMGEAAGKAAAYAALHNVLVREVPYEVIRPEAPRTINVKSE